MVTYKSDGVFDAPADKVWKLLTQEHTPEKVTKIHTNILSVKNIENKGNVLVQDSTSKGPDGKPVTSRIRFTFNPPKGFNMEWLTGPLAGSKCTHAYTPQGAKTKVDLTGDFKIPGMDDASTVKIVDQFMTDAFNADNAFIRTMK